MRAVSNFAAAYVMNSFADLCFTTYFSIGGEQVQSGELITNTKKVNLGKPSKSRQLKSFSNLHYKLHVGCKKNLVFGKKKLQIHHKWTLGDILETLGYLLNAGLHTNWVEFTA